jgi:DNA repair exonuclease SbcCD ATPase subunit
MEITKLILKNFRTHKSAAFEFAAGVTGIIGGNGSGKSSIVEAVIFLLTGEGYGKTKHDMLTVGETSGYVIGHLTINDKEAVLERHIDTAKVNFMYDGKTYKKSSEVNEIWDHLFQIDKNIVQNVVVSNQGEIALLFNGDNATKEKLFQKIFMVPNTTKIRDVVWNNYLKEAPPEYPVKDVVVLQSDVQCLQKTIELAEEELSQLPSDNKQYEELIARKAYLGKVEEAFDKQGQLGKKMEEASGKSQQLGKAVDALKDKMQLIRIQDYRECLAEQKAQKSIFDTRSGWLAKNDALHAPAIAIDKEAVQQLRQKEMELEADLKVKRTAVAELNKKIEEYEKSGLASGVCPTCGTKVENIAQLVAHTDRERAIIVNAGKQQKADLVALQQQIQVSSKHWEAWEVYEKELQAVNNALDVYKDVDFDQEAYDLCASVVDKYSDWEHKLSVLTFDLREADSVVQKLRVEIASLVTYDKNIIEFNSEKIVIGQKIIDFQKTQETVRKLEIEIATNKREMKSIEQELKDNAVYVDKNNKRKEYVHVLKNVYDLFHTGRFPRALIQTYSSTVSDYMNDVLSSFDFPYSAKVNESFGIDIFNAEGLQLPAISGGQQVMVGFSLRLALHNMFVGAFPFMIIDEGSYGLNSDNAKKYFDIIKTLGKSSKFKQVIVIDHHSELSEYVDNTISL